MNDLTIRIEGLDELRKALRQADKGLAQNLGKAGKQAADIVAREARPRVPERTGRAARSVRAATSRGGGDVKGGGSTVPYFGFLEFGNKLHAGHGVGRGDSQRRPFVKQGRYIFAAFADKRPEVERTYQELLTDVLRAADLI